MGVCVSLHPQKSASEMPVVKVVSSIRTKVPRLHAITDSSLLKSRSRLRSSSASPNETVDGHLGYTMDETLLPC